VKTPEALLCNRPAWTVSRAADLSQTIEFGRFTVIRHRRALLADARPIELRARTFDTLMVLIDARGTDLGKDERRPRNFFFEGESRGKDRPSEGLSGKR